MSDYDLICEVGHKLATNKKPPNVTIGVSKSDLMKSCDDILAGFMDHLQEKNPDSLPIMGERDMRVLLLTGMEIGAEIARAKDAQ